MPGEEVDTPPPPRLFLLDSWMLFCKVIWSVDFLFSPILKKVLDTKKQMFFILPMWDNIGVLYKNNHINKVIFVAGSKKN